ncbi:acyl-CoA thioesterase [Minwuia thermotolerans]|uniref:Uncharacterized protein n=1 Tax=Minwuia thermotolerans TaxID=2056226 RepID=A0A2M9G1I1_9PROT|nr:acyl-CoA thioesterase [Minwuia thermotolerans]PJK29524.1 hypothetical protein CVT23_10705 [Minwuia thermotolerans]
MKDNTTDPRTPQVVARAPFTVRRLVRWGDSDPAGIVYTGTYLDYMVEAAEDFFIALTGRHWRDMQTESGTGTPMVHASMDFLKPVPAGQAIDIAVHVGRLGASSFDLHFISRTMAGDVCFTGKLTGVHIRHVGPGAIAAQAMPADWKAKLADYAKAFPVPEK